MKEDEKPTLLALATGDSSTIKVYFHALLHPLFKELHPNLLAVQIHFGYPIGAWPNGYPVRHRE